MRKANEELWKICFGDSDAFIRLYFDRCATPDNTMAVWQNDRLAAALQMLPFSITFPAEPVPAAYVSGACTHPDFRNQGLMRTLLTQTHRRLFADGAWFSFLIPAEPWLWNYYAQSGYAPAFRQISLPTIIPQAAETPGLRISRCKTEGAPEITDFCLAAMRERPCFVQHTAEHLQAAAADLQLSGGDVWVAAGEQTRGVMFVLPQEGECRILEAFFADEIAKNSLLATAGKFYGTNVFWATRPALSGENGNAAGMVRVLRPESALAAFARSHPDVSAAFALRDDDLPQNSATYLVSDGKCRVVQERVPGTTSVNASELGRWLFERLNAGMSLMMN